MNPRMTGKITKKYLGDQGREGDFGWSRMDSVYVLPDGAAQGAKGVRFSYYSNADKGQQFAGPEEAGDGIADRYAECQEGMQVDIEYTTKESNGKTYNNIKDMMPHGSTLPAHDPVARMTAKPTPAHLKPGPEPEEPLPALPESMTGVKTASERYAGDDVDPQSWRIARSVAVKEVNAAATGGMLPALAETWGLPKETEIAAVARVIARFIVNG